MKLFGHFSISFALLTPLCLAVPAPDPGPGGDGEALSLPNVKVDRRALAGLRGEKERRTTCPTPVTVMTTFTVTSTLHSPTTITIYPTDTGTVYDTTTGTSVTVSFTTGTAYFTTTDATVPGPTVVAGTVVISPTVCFPLDGSRYNFNS